jgi:hypothetical protein
MDRQRLGSGTGGERRRLVGIAIVALLAGALLGPGLAYAASTAWVKVKNWPALQKVLVMNSASAPVYTQPPAHEMVNLYGSAQIPSNSFNNTWPKYYTVPSDRWLVITSLRMEGDGDSPISFVDLTSYTNTHLNCPIQPYVDNGQTTVSSSVSGPMYVPPGTVLYLSMFRNSAPNTPYNAEVWADGYLTAQP